VPLLTLIFIALGAFVPLYGVFVLGWNTATVMILLALECLVSFGPMGLRILRHERVSRDPRHTQPAVYGRFGSWVIPSTGGRFLADYVTRGGIGAVALVGLACLMPLLFRHKYPAQAYLMQVQWSGVALGAAAAAALAALESGLRWPRWGRESFSDLHRAAGGLLLLMLGMLLLLMFSPLWLQWIRHPLALLLPMLGLRAWLDVTRGLPRSS
jgi:hypothetical protein